MYRSNVNFICDLFTTKKLNDHFIICTYVFTSNILININNVGLNFLIYLFTRKYNSF